MGMLETLTLKMLLPGFLILFTLMSLAAIVSRKTKNAGIVDVIWASGFSALMIYYDFVTPSALPRHWIFSFMVIAASLRLAFHLYQRYTHEFPKEDARYHVLRQLWEQQGQRPDFNFFWLFQLQALLMIILSLPFALILLHSEPRPIQVVEWLAVTLWVIGFVGEAVADGQLKTFKANAESKGKTCQVGLWQYSRHPNYFFEWLLWVSYFVFALGAPYGWLTFYCPLLMVYFLIKVTGVAASEAQSLKSKPDYKQYQETTSPFFPWFKRKSTQSLS